MSVVEGILLVLVGLVGGFVVTRVVQKFVSTKKPAVNWEYLIVVLIGAGILIWPVAQQVSLRGAGKKLAQYRQILELKDLESYRLVKIGSGETLEIVEDQQSGEIRLQPTGVSKPKPAEGGQSTESVTPTPSASPSRDSSL